MILVLQLLKADQLCMCLTNSSPAVRHMQHNDAAHAAGHAAVVWTKPRSEKQGKTLNLPLLKEPD